MWTFTNTERTKIRRLTEKEILERSGLSVVWEENRILKEKVRILINLIEECGLEHKIKDTKKNKSGRN